MDKRNIKTGALTGKQLRHHLYLEQKNNDSGKFMKIRRVIIPTLTLIAIMASSVPSAFAMTPVEATDLLDGSEMVVVEVADVDAITSASPSYTSDGQRIVYASNNSVEVSTVDKSVLGADFKDVGQSDWFYNAVMYMADHGGINGYPDGTFKPQGEITRIEFASIILNSVGGGNAVTKAVEATNADPINYTTVDELNADNNNFWGNGVIVAASYYNVNPFGTSVEEWGKNIDRGEMARIAIAAQETIGGETFIVTGDVQKSITDYNVVSGRSEKTYIEKAYQAGILTGDRDHNYNPNESAKRAEAATIAMHVIDPSTRGTMWVPEEKPQVDVNAGQVYDLTNPNRSDAVAGMVVTNSQGQKVTLAVGKSGVLGEGQGVALDLGRIESDGIVVKDSVASDGNMSGSRLGELYIISKATSGPTVGEGHWQSHWDMIEKAYPAPKTDGTKNGQVSSDGFWYWNSFTEDGQVYGYWTFVA